EQGVALAAIQGLYATVQEKDTTIRSQGAEIAALNERVAALERGPGQAAAVPTPILPELRLAWGLALMGFGLGGGYGGCLGLGLGLALAAGAALTTPALSASCAGNFCFVGGGNDNHADGIYSVAVGGNVNRAYALGSAILGGHSNEASGAYSTISAGYDSAATD